MVVDLMEIVELSTSVLDVKDRNGQIGSGQTILIQPPVLVLVNPYPDCGQLRRAESGKAVRR